MGNIVSNFAFICPPSSYTYKLSGLEFVERDVITQRIPIRYYQKDKDLPTMIICHGNAEDIGQEDPQMLANMFNVNICLFDYAGYGLHSCKYASEYNCQQDVIAVYQHLKRVKKINNIIIYGRSLGSGISVYLASLTQCKLILVSPLYSVANVVTDMWIPGDIFRNYLLAPDIKSQVLILHGNNDNVVPFVCGKKLSLLFPNLYEFVILKGCGHNDISTVQYYNKIREFVLNSCIYTKSNSKLDV